MTSLRHGFLDGSCVLNVEFWIWTMLNSCLNSAQETRQRGWIRWRLHNQWSSSRSSRDHPYCQRTAPKRSDGSIYLPGAHTGKYHHHAGKLSFISVLSSASLFIRDALVRARFGHGTFGPKAVCRYTTLAIVRMCLSVLQGGIKFVYLCYRVE